MVEEHIECVGHTLVVSSDEEHVEVFWGRMIHSGTKLSRVVRHGDVDVAGGIVPI